jgi:dTDP-4-amino-4,6-dideoxygalactose transaminase
VSNAKTEATRPAAPAPAPLPPKPAAPIAFIDLAAQQRRLGGAVERAIAGVLAHGQYILGPEVAELERRLAAFCGAGHAVACANGTDALALTLMVKGVRPGDAVLVPAFTFAATAEVVPWLGAMPVFVDVRADTFNMDPDSLEQGVLAARQAGLEPRGVIAVDLFGQPADYDALGAVCEAHGLWLIADAAQSFGAAWQGRPVGTLAEMTTTSFFPAKPLGCYGDGGAVLTDDEATAALLRSLALHGQGEDRNDYVRIGMNARFDTLQAAILLEKLGVFAEEIRARQAIADRYARGLGGVVRTPAVRPGATSVWAQYTVVPDGGAPFDRAGLIGRLRAHGVPAAVYYPRPLHRQPAYAHCPVAGAALPVSDRLAERVFSLPMHPYLEPAVQDYIIAVVRRALES